MTYEEEGWTVVPTSPASRGKGCKMQRYRFVVYDDGSRVLTLFPEFKRAD
jgi:hypothetical protein